MSERTITPSVVDAAAAYLAGAVFAAGNPIGTPDPAKQLQTLRGMMEHVVRLLVSAGAKEPPRFEGERPPHLLPHDDLQRAHDLLVGVLVGEAPKPSLSVRMDFALARDYAKYGDIRRADAELLMAELRAYADVLCWGMDHDHNRRFPERMAEIEQDLAQSGWVLSKAST